MLTSSYITQVLMLKSKPIVVLVNLWGSASCPVPRYLLHSFYYQIPLIAVCPAVNLCYGKHHLPKFIFEQYSKTDGVHPWGSNGVKFLGEFCDVYLFLLLFDVLVVNKNRDFDDKILTHCMCIALVAFKCFRKGLLFAFFLLSSLNSQYKHISSPLQATFSTPGGRSCTPLR
jgi:hypothetical protein